MIFNILVFILSFMLCLILSVAFYPAQANFLSLGEINSSQLVIIIVESYFVTTLLRLV